MRYVAVVALVLTGLGTQLQSLHSFDEAMTPAWIGGTLIMLGGVVAAVFVRPPGTPPS
jgi:hypothetical protein